MVKNYYARHTRHVEEEARKNAVVMWPRNETEVCGLQFTEKEKIEEGF